MPAILSGFFDRVFTTGFAIRFNKYGIPIKLLRGKKAIVFISSSASKLMANLFLGNRAEKIIKLDILQLCGISTKVYRIGGSKILNDIRKENIRRTIKQGLKRFR